MHLLISVLFVSAIAGLPVDETLKPEKIFNKQLNENIKDMQHKEMDKDDKIHEKLAQVGSFEIEQLSEDESAFIAKNLEQLKHVKIDTRRKSCNLVENDNKSGMSKYMNEGDNRLTESQLKSLELKRNLAQSTVKSRLTRQVYKHVKKWTNNTVNYYIDGSINQKKRVSIAAAIRHLEERTCIRFRENVTAHNRIKIFAGKACFSDIGMVGGEQELSLEDDCESIGTVIHEFMHALGIDHMHCRSDRDRYVHLYLDNVPEKERYNFHKMKVEDTEIFGPYEFGSIMHYSAVDFVNKSIGGISIYPTRGNWKYLYTMGNEMLTYSDVQLINSYYGCNLKCKAATSAKCMNGGQPHPNNCSICLCPLGYDGDLCDKRPVGIPTVCGTDLMATDTWQSYTFSVGNSNVNDDFDICTTWITAPPGKFVTINLTGMENNTCVYGCTLNGIEFKLEDQKGTNPRYCCEDFTAYNQTLTAKLNPLPVIAYNQEHTVSFTFEYKYT